ncbi:MAG: CoA-binding protein [Peptococcaceae bacterium]|nr:CoA-binding protein [Peptococcaceae bacterium]
MDNPDDTIIKAILEKSKTVAVVGLSPKKERDSYKVAAYLQKHGYDIIPVYPREEKILGAKVFRELADIPGQVDIVNVFRRSDQVMPVVEQAIRLKPKAIWLQLGIVNEEAAMLAESKGIVFVMNRCIKIEHERLLGDVRCM